MKEEISEEKKMYAYLFVHPHPYSPMIVGITTPGKRDDQGGSRFSFGKRSPVDQRLQPSW